MIESLGRRVLKLARVRIGHLKLGDLTSGRWRLLTRDEVKSLMPSR